MQRCDYCSYKNSWDCDDGYNRISNDVICENFKLDYDLLNNKQKKTIQRILMNEKTDNYYYD